MVATPCAMTGIIFFAAVSSGFAPTVPNMVGREGPNTSASSRPTRRPDRAAATARLLATVDLPTPPFAEATATMPRAGRTVDAGGGGGAAGRGMAAGRGGA